MLNLIITRGYLKKTDVYNCVEILLHAFYNQAFMYYKYAYLHRHDRGKTNLPDAI